jgi:hypothetical protein
MELTVASVGKPHKVKCNIKYEAIGEGAPAAPISVSQVIFFCSKNKNNFTHKVEVQHQV